MASYNLEETKILLRQAWTFLLMGLYGIGIFQERSVVLQTAAAQAAESIFSDMAKVIFFALIFVSFLIDIVEMREDKNRAYQFLFLSLDLMHEFHLYRTQNVPLHHHANRLYQLTSQQHILISYQK